MHIKNFIKHTCAHQPETSPSVRSKTLITVPALDKPGGVAALYNVLQLDNDAFEHFEVQGCWHEASAPLRFLEITVIYLRLLLRIRKVEVVMLNPSFNKKSFLRDAVLCLFTRLFRKRVIVFWHGWSDEFFKVVEKSLIYRYIFRTSYSHANRSIVLANRFKKDLLELGQKGTICLESNTADVRYLNSGVDGTGFAFTSKPYILFMARIVREKGVFIAIDAFQEISTEHEVDLLIAGTGPDFESAKKYVDQSILRRVHFVGHISAEEKHKALANASICLFPTYSEGMPLTAIEALAYGKPLITRPEGGISDWMTHEKNAIIEESKDPEQFAEWLTKLLSDSDYADQIGCGARELFDQSFHPEVMRKRMLEYSNSNIR